MKLSFDWLSEFVDLSGLTPQEVADRLTMGAFEVEEVRKVGPDIAGPVVVGEIVAITPHPNADKIRLTKVYVSPDAEAVEIVCGAANILVGQRVPVALPGARVINRHDGTALEIKQSKIRGVVSNGMLCSPPELGLTAPESDGILVLEGLPDVGADAQKLLSLYPDWVLTVEPRSNRGDALSVVGMAREVAALFGRPLKEPNWSLPSEDYTSTTVDVEIEDLDDCPFFSIRVIEGLEVRRSDLEMARRLEAVGVRAVNNLVDVTNYVLHERGQPLHAYDLKNIKGQRLSVRRASPGELLTTIDGRARELSPDVLAIADGERVVGVAGVMGGKDSEVGDDTTFVALEAAAFAPSRVRRSSRLIGLSSDSSVRFERGVDVASVLRASDRAAYLMLKLGGGFLGKLTNMGSDRVKPVTVPMRLPQIRRLLEIDVPADKVTSLLSPLGFTVTTSGDRSDTVAVEVPSFRQRDVTREIDVIEEVCRLWGYDRIPVSMPKTSKAPAVPDPMESDVRQSLSILGLNETWISSLTAESALGGDDGEHNGEDSVVRVLNPLSEDHQVLRQSLLPGLVKAAAYNQDRGRTDVWLFELGRTYQRHGAMSDKEAGARESLHVGAVMVGGKELSSWLNQESDGSDDAERGFFTAKGVMENLLRKLSVREISCPGGQGAPPWFHPGRSTRVEACGEGRVNLGWLGQLHPAAADAVGVRGNLYMFEIDLDAVKKVRRQVRFEEIYTTPAVARDLTVDLPQEVDQESVCAGIRQSAGEFLRQIELVSVFRLSHDARSLSFRLTFQHPTETLTNEALEGYLGEVRQTLKEKLSATFRI